MTSLGAIAVYAKPLAPNDNSKNQVYVGGSDDVFAILPPITVERSRQTKRGIAFYAKLDFWWIRQTGDSEQAAGTQLIYYPQYPEVRMSGFLRGCTAAPNSVMASREPQRLLCLGVTQEGRVLAFACTGDHVVARQFFELRARPSRGVFVDLRAAAAGPLHWRRELMRELCRVSQAGWIEGKRLASDGIQVPCNSSNCVGYTLECELGISANGIADPDYHGWELKAFTVSSLESPSGQTITLMTPEPTGGVYRNEGPETFVRRFGYRDRNGRPDRLNFGGVFRAGLRHGLTGLTMTLVGYDRERDLILEPHARLALVDDSGVEAASWSFTGLLDHWRRKHANTVYVPATCRTGEPRYYYYGRNVLVGTNAGFQRLIGALGRGTVYYDPGIKLEGVSTRSPKIKRRSQFRVRFVDLQNLYQTWECVDACSDG